MQKMTCGAVMMVFGIAFVTASLYSAPLSQLIIGIEGIGTLLIALITFWGGALYAIYPEGD